MVQKMIMLDDSAFKMTLGTKRSLLRTLCGVGGQSNILQDFDTHTHACLVK